MGFFQLEVLWSLLWNPAARLQQLQPPKEEEGDAGTLVTLLSPAERSKSGRQTDILSPLLCRLGVRWKRLGVKWPAKVAPPKNPLTDSVVGLIGSLGPATRVSLAPMARIPSTASLSNCHPHSAWTFPRMGSSLRLKPLSFRWHLFMKCFLTQGLNLLPPHYIKML